MAEPSPAGSQERGARAGRPTRLPRWLQEAIPPALLGLFVLVAWQAVAVRSGLSAFILSSPLRVAGGAWETRAPPGPAGGPPLGRARG